MISFTKKQRKFIYKNTLNGIGNIYEEFICLALKESASKINEVVNTYWIREERFEKLFPELFSLRDKYSERSGESWFHGTDKNRLEKRKKVLEECIKLCDE